jgi:hypothetical protein
MEGGQGPSLKSNTVSINNELSILPLSEMLLVGPRFQCKVHIFLVNHTQCSLRTLFDSCNEGFKTTNYILHISTFFHF